MMPLPAGILSQHVAVLGKTRSGKSSVMRLLVESLLDEKKPVCIVDPKGDWFGLKSSADGKSAGYPVIIFGGEHADIPLNPHAGAHVAELVATGNRPCIIDLGGWFVADRTRFFIDFASTLFRHTRGPRWLVIDEVHNFAPQGKVIDPEAGKMLHWANRLASEGAGKGLTIMSASQRPQKVHKDFLTCHETLIAMRVIHPLDRGAIKDWIDGCPDPAKGREVLQSLASMARGEGWVWSPEIGFGPVRVQFPMFQTYDSFKAPTGEAAAKLRGWASVDLDDVKTKLAAVVEEAKQNDPKALKAEIARLQKLAASKPIVGPSYEEGKSHGYSEGRVDGYDEGRGSAIGLLRGVSTELFGIFEKIERTLEMVIVTGPTSKIADVAQPVEQRPSKPQGAGSNPVVRSNPPRRAEGVTGPQQKILDALAGLEGLGIAQPSRTQLALWADVSPTSGGYFNNLGTLRTAGLIDYPTSGVVALTDAGRATAAPPDTMTAQEMLDALCRKVGNAKAAIVRALTDIYPDEISRDDLANKIGVSPTSGGYFNNLGALRTLGVIDYPTPGFVVAQPILFLEGR